MSERTTAATDGERTRWVEDAHLGFVRPAREPYVRDKTVVAKILALDVRIEAEKRRADIATDLLKRVQVLEARWTDEERDCWCCDLKDFLAGRINFVGQSHGHCHHAGGGNDYRKAKGGGR